MKNLSPNWFFIFFDAPFHVPPQALQMDYKSFIEIEKGADQWQHVMEMRDYQVIQVDTLRETRYYHVMLNHATYKSP